MCAEIKQYILNNFVWCFPILPKRTKGVPIIINSVSKGGKQFYIILTEFLKWFKLICGTGTWDFPWWNKWVFCNLKASSSHSSRQSDLTALAEQPTWTSAFAAFLITPWCDTSVFNVLMAFRTSLWGFKILNFAASHCTLTLSNAFSSAIHYHLSCTAHVIMYHKDIGETVDKKKEKKIK